MSTRDSVGVYQAVHTDAIVLEGESRNDLSPGEMLLVAEGTKQQTVVRALERR